MGIKIDLDEMRKRSEFINERISPSGNLIIWSYNAKCQWERSWDKCTIMARGLITDSEGNVIARPFPKFFNLGESEETMFNNLPKELPVITDKLDGSLGILYSEYNEINIATKGSFVSSQSVWATKWIRDRYSKESFSEGYTYLFEIIYPDNRIVVDYRDKKELVLLAVIETETGKELNHIVMAKKLKMNYSNVYGGSINQAIQSLPNLDSNQEGYVARYSSGLRVKLKGDEYKRLHKLLTQFSTISIWGNMKAGYDFKEIYDRVPEEFIQWVKTEKKKLQERYDEIYFEALDGLGWVSGYKNRKEQALRLKKDYPNSMGLVFAMIDNKFKEEMIWKRIRPKFILPFKEE